VESSDHDPTLAQLEATLARIEERTRQWQAQDAARAQTPEAPAPQTSPLRPWDPKDFDTTIAQVRRMAQKDVHPTWFQAAYADLAGRLARVEDLLEDLGASMSLLHTKMETIIGQLAAAERQQDGGTDA
jgi:hypothetical protein